MAYTLEEYTQLKAALASGATSVSHNGRTVTYRSLEEIRGILATMAKELGLAPVRTQRRDITYASYRRGQ